MSCLWYFVVSLVVYEIQGFDFERKLWENNAKPADIQTAFDETGSKTAGRELSSQDDDLPELDREMESYLTGNIPDVGERGVPIIDDELPTMNDEKTRTSPRILRTLPKEDYNF